jgi:hypothetical protein
MIQSLPIPPPFIRVISSIFSRIIAPFTPRS